MAPASDVVIVDSGGANLASLIYALERHGATAEVSTEPARIAAARRVLLPGVGAASDAMGRLDALGLVAVLPSLTQPVLGICLGMQLLCEWSAEGATQCLGIAPGRLERLEAAAGFPVPHMGWNQLESLLPDPLFDGLDEGARMYFVHSYALAPNATTVAQSRYSEPLAAALRIRNFWGVQFHPERSGPAGARLLGNFLALPCS